MQVFSEIIDIKTKTGISVVDITSQVKSFIENSNVSNGFVLITSRHTTTAITVNENEDRLLEDIGQFFKQLVPSDGKYLHNDIHLRDCPPDEPENAHSHLCSMLLGNSEAVPIQNRQISLGTYQSIMLVEFDGPRSRQINVQIFGE